MFVSAGGGGGGGRRSTGRISANVRRSSSSSSASLKSSRLSELSARSRSKSEGWDGLCGSEEASVENMVEREGRGAR